MRDNVTAVVFAPGSATGHGDSLWQYDYGQKLRFEGLDLPATFEVHMGNSPSGAASVAVGTDNTVDIPDAYLQNAGALHIWIYLHSGDSDGETVYRAQLLIRGRAKPADTAPTPAQQDVITQTIAALNTAVNDAETAAAALENAAAFVNRVTSLNATPLHNGVKIVESIGVPVYLEAADLSAYSGYGLTLPGWYIFARIGAPDGRQVTAGTSVSGAAGSIVTVGAEYVDVAVRYDVAALAVAVVVTWGPDTETFVFRANDLALRNLDYRTTFYIYDIAEFARWEWKLTEDANFKADQNYYTKNGDVYTLAEVQTVQYNLTADATFQTGKKYYTREGDVYTEATVTAGEAVTTDTYYEASDVPVPADTYYVHAKLIFEGMSKNVTYQFNEIVDYAHFCVFCGLDADGKAVICNPDKGRYRVSKGIFKSFYSGVSLFNGEPQDIGEGEA